MEKACDFLVIGSGLAGLAYALKVADHGKVLVVAKSNLEDTNTNQAQGGIATVTSSEDSFEKHIEDTLVAGAGLCHEDIVRMCVEQAPDRLKDLQNWQVKFDSSLTREGGHSERRILHVGDHTGRDIQRHLTNLCRKHPNIEMVERHMVIDLLTSRKIYPFRTGQAECFGCYALNIETGKVIAIRSRFTVLATGGAGKVYLYTSNWEGSTGDGVALAWRAGARVSNLEFIQFHPTCLYHPQARNFLITEAMRGEGGELKNAKGDAFMKKYHPLGALAPRDIVARSIDAEMKLSGAECVYLDISHKDPEFIKSRFPTIYEKCLSYGIDITKQAIPVVPAAHYTCGGVVVDQDGATDIRRLMAIGETACTGLHGANRLASNSLLECLVYAHQAAQKSLRNFNECPALTEKIPAWIYHGTEDRDEMIVISHMWDEIRRLMWNYVGIVRSNKRLERAKSRLENIRSEIREYYWNFRVHPDILELRNLALVAQLSVLCALRRQESRGIHFNIDFPPEKTLPPADTILAPTSPD